MSESFVITMCTARVSPIGVCLCVGFGFLYLLDMLQDLLVRTLVNYILINHWLTRFRFLRYSLMLSHHEDF